MTQPAQEQTRPISELTDMMEARKAHLEKCVLELEDQIMLAKSEIINITHTLLGYKTSKKSTDMATMEYGVVLENVIKVFPCTELDIISTSRVRESVVPRQMCMYFLSKYTTQSLKRIGQHFGNRDHSTVIHAKDAISDMIDTDRSFKTKFDIIDQSLGKIFHHKEPIKISN